MISENDGEYEGMLADGLITGECAVVEKACGRDKRPHGYYLLVRYWLGKGEVAKAREWAEKGVQQAQVESF